MAFKSQRLARTLAGLMTSMAASIAGAQVASQPAATGSYGDPRYAAQPAAYNAPAGNYAGQPAGYAAQPAASRTPLPANAQPLVPPQRYAAQPQGNVQPAGYTQPAAYGQPAQAAPSYAQPAAYGQPAATVASAAGRYGQPPAQRAPASTSYPGANAAGASGVMPVQYEQPINAAPAGAAAAPAAAPGAAPLGAAAQEGVAHPLYSQPAAAAAAGEAPGIQATEVSAAPVPNTVPTDVAGGQAAQEHPLMPAVRWAKQGLETFNQIQDYSCTLVKRERIDGTLGEHEYMFVKVRHHPFSVYTYFLAPARVKGQEAIFVEGQNGGSLLAHPNGIKHKLIGTVSLKPTSALAMTGNRYPITEMGIRRLLERLVEVGGNDVKYGECKVNWIQGAKVNNRTCTCIQVEHPIPRRNFLFHIARIYVDDEAQLPIRYEAYDWPAPGTTEPQLMEEYTFLNVKLNNGFTDADFSVENSKYGFK